MGFKLFSASSNEGYCPSSTKEPRADLFEIKFAKNINRGKSCVLMISYPNCENFEGNKICVFRHSLKYMEKQKLIDPHFSSEGLSPFARFEPTEEGWNMAIELAKRLK
jgi:hypothetical protein